MNATLDTAFEEYAANYNLQDAKIRLKYFHTRRVAENCVRIARSLRLPECDVRLAWEMGMLHDIGRFEQVRRYHTFIDSESIDHAQFGADLLFGDGLIGRFGVEGDDYAIIEKAVRFHSCYRLPEDLQERELLFCQIVRDADKIDIFRANYETGLDAIYNVTPEELAMSPVTPAVFDAFLERHAVLRSLKRTPVDHLIGHLSLAYELVYPESMRMLSEQGYAKKLLQFESKNPQTQKILLVAAEKYQELERESAVDRLKAALDLAYKENYPELDELLWETLLLFQGYEFCTAKQLTFSYKIKGNEMFVSRRSKSITRATVLLTFHKALELQRTVPGPKALGTFGASYLYPVFRRTGVLL